VLDGLGEGTEVGGDRWRAGHLSLDGHGSERLDVRCGCKDSTGVAEQIGPLLAGGEADVLDARIDAAILTDESAA
jgi:hypothetical protein